MNGRSRILEAKRPFSFINLDPRILLGLKILCFRSRFCFKFLAIRPNLNSNLR